MFRPVVELVLLTAAALTLPGVSAAAEGRGPDMMGTGSSNGRTW
jgi:hypothetical protein